jgi:hypothetical protein
VAGREGDPVTQIDHPLTRLDAPAKLGGVGRARR